jgi:hypothetical protein
MATANCIINIAWADKPIAESTLIETVNVSELNIEEHNIGEDFETVPSVKDEFTEITEELKTHTELADALKEAINHCKKSQETFKYKREYAFDLKQHHDSRFNNIRFRGFQNLISDIIDKAKHSVKIFGGVPRDLMRRSKGSQEFQQFCEQFVKKHMPTATESIQQDIIRVFFEHQYMNKSIDYNSYEKRTCCPRDLDVFIKEDKYTAVIRDLRENYNISITDAYARNYYGNIQMGTLYQTNVKDWLYHKKVTVHLLKMTKGCEQMGLFQILFKDFAMQFENVMEFNIDFIVIRNPESMTAATGYNLSTSEMSIMEREYNDFITRALQPPFQKGEYLCNMLNIVYNPNWIYNQNNWKFEVNEYITDLYHSVKLKRNAIATDIEEADMELKSRIYSDIYNGVCTPFSDKIDKYRTERMRSKGFLKFDFSFLLENQLFCWKLERLVASNSLLDKYMIVKEHLYYHNAGCNKFTIPAIRPNPSNEEHCRASHCYTPRESLNKTNSIKPCADCNIHCHTSCFAAYYFDELDLMLDADKNMYESNDDSVKCRKCKKQFAGNYYSFAKQVLTVNPPRCLE